MKPSAEHCELISKIIRIYQSMGFNYDSINKSKRVGCHGWYQNTVLHTDASVFDYFFKLYLRFY